MSFCFDLLDPLPIDFFPLLARLPKQCSPWEFSLLSRKSPRIDCDCSHNLIYSLERSRWYFGGITSASFPPTIWAPLSFRSPQFGTEGNSGPGPSWEYCKAGFLDDWTDYPAVSFTRIIFRQPQFLSSIKLAVGAEPNRLAKILFSELIRDWCSDAIDEKIMQSYTSVCRFFHKRLFFHIFWRSFERAADPPLLLVADVPLQPRQDLRCTSWVQQLDPAKRVTSVWNLSPLPLLCFKKFEGLRAFFCRNTGVVLARATKCPLLLVTHLIERALY